MKNFKRISRRNFKSIGVHAKNQSRSTLLFLLLFAIAAIAIPYHYAHAANPASGTITASGAPLTFTGTATATGAAMESACVEGLNCDTYTLTVGGAASDYNGKVVEIKIQWTNMANDYDLFIHKDSNNGPIVGQSANGAPQTSEAASISPSSAGVGVYTVHVLYFAVTPNVDQPQGTITVSTPPQSRSANYLTGDAVFSANVALKAPVAARDGEPSSRTDQFGNAYVGGIRGVPAGVDLWYFDLRPTIGGLPNPGYDPNMRNYIYRGQPDSGICNDPNPAACGGADGGGDIDLAVGRPQPANLPNPGTNNDPPTLALTSLVAANISGGKSADRGQTFTYNPAGNVTGGIPGDDREWQEFYGKDICYLLYRTLAPAVTQIQRSTDGGLTYGPAATAGQIGQVGQIDVHQTDGVVYISGSTGQVCVGTPSIAGQAPLSTDYVCNVAASDPNGVAHIFFNVKVAEDGTPNGTAYVTYSNDHDVFIAHSTDKGATWSLPVRVSNGPQTLTAVFPHLETGPTPGSIGVVWYGTSEPTNNDNANWKVFFAQSFNASSPVPTFSQVTLSDHFIHGSNISEGGLTGAANRNLIDYFQISFDPNGAAVVAYTDDHNDFDGHTYVARQISGTSINGVPVPPLGEGTALPPPPNQPLPTAASVGGIAGSQVTDFANDVQTGQAGRINAPDPFDVLSIKYSCEAPSNPGVDPSPVLVATMKVSLLTATPPAANYRMNFAANVPDSTISPTGDYSFGLSDRGDQFFLLASTDPSSQFPFSYGTATRLSTGAMAYTIQGPADCGAFDTTNGTITVKVATSKLNQFIPAGHAQISDGAVLAGLRGQTFTSGANGKRDIARGGTQYTLGSCSAAVACPATTPPPPVQRGQVIISEFRLRGSGGVNDEFVELYNTTDSTITVGTSDGSAGWSVAGADGVMRFTIPNGSQIPARGHLLGVHETGYSLNTYPSGIGTATKDVTTPWTTDVVDNTGIALFATATQANFNNSTVLDAVGFGATAAPYSEGTPLAPINAADGEFSFVRRITGVSGSGGPPVDSNNNASDFALVSTTGCIGTLNGSTCTGTPTQLGAPGPENLSSPRVNTQIAPSYVDPTTCAACEPNRKRVGSGNAGTLAIRRQFTNNTGADVTRLRFHIIDITTLGSPASGAPPQAILEAVTSGSDTATVFGAPVTIQGTTLEQPPAQPLGGGLNSSLTTGTVSMTSPLVAGQSINVQFVMNVVMNGRFRFFVNIEALP